MQAWQHWYHVTIGTYGTWLPGDARGWREKGHRQHVDGDYRRPPKATEFAAARNLSAKQLMKFEPYIIEDADKEAIGALVLRSLAHQRVLCSAIAVSVRNLHLLIQCLRDNPKAIAGNVKRQVAFGFAPILDAKTKERRPIFEEECGAKPIRDLLHGRRTHRYILDHRVKEKAWVWNHRAEDVEAIGPRRIATGLLGEEEAR